MNSRWQANKIGLINFWYYDEQEFPFVKGRMLLRGSNGSGKSVTMQSVVPLLLDGNMSPERLDPFGSRDRKMSSYLLEENDGREERTGYLYLEFKRQDSQTYLTIGMGIRARKGKPLDKWYFSLNDGRRIGKDFFLYKKTSEKVTLSKKELENRIGEGGCVMDRQADYMEYVNHQIFGFETAQEYREMIDLLIQLRTPKLSKDFKPSVVNEILSDSLQPLSDEDLRPMSEAIENMDSLNVNLKSRREAKVAAEKIHAVFRRYNQRILYEKAAGYERARVLLEEAENALQEHAGKKEACDHRIEELDAELERMGIRKEEMEKERDSLSKSDAVSLKNREAQLVQELQRHQKNLKEKEVFLESKQDQYRDLEKKIKDGEDRRYQQEKEREALLEEMQDEAESMAFEEQGFMQEELLARQQERYDFSLHQKQFEDTRDRIRKGSTILAETQRLEKEKDNRIREREKSMRELSSAQRKMAEVESVSVQVQNEWKEALYQWNGSNQALVLSDGLLQELSHFADSYEETSDFAQVRQRVADVWIAKKAELAAQQKEVEQEQQIIETQLKQCRSELEAWENQKEPEPERSEAVVRNRQRLKDLGIPYQEFYKMIEFGEDLDEVRCDRLEEALLQMGILDALVVDESYREQVLQAVPGCEDRYLFAGNTRAQTSLLDVLELNGEDMDIFSNWRLTGILGNIAYDGEGLLSVFADGSYQMGVLAGTVSGEHKAGFLGSRARKRHKLARMEACREEIRNLEAQIQKLEQDGGILMAKHKQLEEEYAALPTDTDMREALKMLQAAQRCCAQLEQDGRRLEEQITQLNGVLKEQKQAVLELAKGLYLSCTYEVFQTAEKAAESYGRHLIELKAVHEMVVRSVEYLQESRERLEDLDADLEQARYDISGIQREIYQKTQERNSIQEQLQLTDYEQIKDRLDQCIRWLRSYPENLRLCVQEKTQKQDESLLLEEKLEQDQEKVREYKEKRTVLAEYYEAERALGYVAFPEGMKQDARSICACLESIKTSDKDTIIRDLNRVYFENRGFLNDYQLMQNELFTEQETVIGKERLLARRLDISARYQGVKVSFSSLLQHLEEDIAELETLIRDGDRELFEDILANTVSRKIRGKINYSQSWVRKMNDLMNGMNTSSGLKLSLRWRSKTAEREDQLDTRELVELLKRDYRLMSETEASRLSAHFRSKVEAARKNARDNAGMISFYQIMKETLDYRKWFEFQLFFQKSGERQKELTNTVFGTFSGGEKAMSMYVPLFSAVVARYQGGRSDAPRLISLDEAFAGVDNKNIRDMFRLMTEFQFDFIINSQVLWGDCDTLDALAIYQLIRPQNAKFVTVMPYLWNGQKKELLEEEAALEQKGMELEKAALLENGVE